MNPLTCAMGTLSPSQGKREGVRGYPELGPRSLAGDFLRKVCSSARQRTGSKGYKQSPLRFHAARVRVCSLLMSAATFLGQARAILRTADFEFDQLLGKRRTSPGRTGWCVSALCSAAKQSASVLML